MANKLMYSSGYPVIVNDIRPVFKEVHRFRNNILKSCKDILKFNFSENIIYSETIHHNNLYWRIAVTR